MIGAMLSEKKGGFISAINNVPRGTLKGAEEMNQIFILVEDERQEFVAISTNLNELKENNKSDFDYEILSYIPEKHGTVASFLEVRSVCKKENGEWVETEGENWID